MNCTVETSRENSSAWGFPIATKALLRPTENSKFQAQLEDKSSINKSKRAQINQNLPKKMLFEMQYSNCYTIKRN